VAREPCDPPDARTAAQERQLRRFRALLTFSGLFNVVLAAPLMVPELHARYFALLWKLNGALSLGGQEPVAPVGGVGALLVNTAGIDLVLIGVIVLYAAGDPLARRFIPAANAAGRTVFAGVIAYYVIAYDVARIVTLIGGIDLAISVAFVYFLRSLRAAPPRRAPQVSAAL
jgi:hypothetical protein